MELREVLAALRAGWWLVLLGLVLGGGAGAAVSFLSTPLYTSSTELFVSANDETSTQAVLQGSQFSENRVASYAQLLQGEELGGRVVKQLNLPLSASDLAGEIQATAVPDTVLIDVSVTDPSPERAQQIATAIGQQFPQLVADLETSAPASGSPVKVTVVQQAGLPTTPSSPHTVRNIALGLLAGLLVGATAAIARTRLDRSVRHADVAAHAAGAPVIGTILRDPVLEKQHIYDSQAISAEGYRQLRTNLQFLNVDEPPKVIVISSPVPGEGKTTLVVNLAVALGEIGRTVTIVEADLRRPRVTQYLGMVGGVGLTNILTGTADLQDVIQTYGDGSVSVLGAGPLPPNPGELLASGLMGTLLDQLREKNDFVLIDAPPVLPVADASGLAVMTDGIVLSVRYGRTRKDLLHRTAATLDRVGARKLGVVFNLVPPKVDSGGGYGYDYGYSDHGRHSSRD